MRFTCAVMGALQSPAESFAISCNQRLVLKIHRSTNEEAQSLVVRLENPRIVGKTINTNLAITQKFLLVSDDPDLFDCSWWIDNQLCVLICKDLRNFCDVQLYARVTFFDQKVNFLIEN